MNALATLNAARARYIVAKAYSDTIAAEVIAAHPAPEQGCDDTTFDEWNDRYEDALAAAGAYAASDAVRAAAFAVIAAARDCLVAKGHSLAGTTPAWTAALDGPAFRYSAHVKVLDLSMRLDARAA